MSFFPCVRFSHQILLEICCKSRHTKNFTDVEKAKYALSLQEEITQFYRLITKLAIICLERNIHLVIENPYNPNHYLVKHWPFSAKIIDQNRRENGDYYEKPTQFFFFNREPNENLLFDEPIANHPKRICSSQNQKRRSEISPDYARRFIRRFILDGIR